MPDLTRAAVTAWLERQSPASIGMLGTNAVRPIEDDAVTRNALAGFGEALDHALDQDAGHLGQALQEPDAKDRFRTVLTQLGPARLLRVLHWLSFSNLPGSDAILTGLLQDDGGAPARSLRETLHELNRRELLDRIFGQPRLQTLLTACSTHQQELA